MQIEWLSDYLAVNVNFPEFEKYNVIGQAWERNVVFRWAGVCGEGWKTSSPKNACVGGYCRMFPLDVFFLPAAKKK